jgi:hypothetical protein
MSAAGLVSAASALDPLHLKTMASPKKSSLADLPTRFAWAQVKKRFHTNHIGVASACR